MAETRHSPFFQRRQDRPHEISRSPAGPDPGSVWGENTSLFVKDSTFESVYPGSHTDYLTMIDMPENYQSQEQHHHTFVSDMVSNISIQKE